MCVSAEAWALIAPYAKGHESEEAAGFMLIDEINDPNQLDVSLPPLHVDRDVAQLM